jgi:hypothetical protein
MTTSLSFFWRILAFAGEDEEELASDMALGGRWTKVYENCSETKLVQYKRVIKESHGVDNVGPAITPAITFLPLPLCTINRLLTYDNVVPGQEHSKARNLTCGEDDEEFLATTEATVHDK